MQRPDWEVLGNGRWLPCAWLHVCTTITHPTLVLEGLVHVHATPRPNVRPSPKINNLKINAQVMPYAVLIARIAFCQGRVQRGSKWHQRPAAPGCVGRNSPPARQYGEGGTVEGGTGSGKPGEAGHCQLWPTGSCFRCSLCAGQLI